MVVREVSLCSPSFLERILVMVKNIIFLVLLFGAFVGFGLNIKRLWGYLSLGQPDLRFDQPGQRLKNVFTIAFADAVCARCNGSRDCRRKIVRAGRSWSMISISPGVYTVS